MKTKPKKEKMATGWVTYREDRIGQVLLEAMLMTTLKLPARVAWPEFTKFKARLKRAVDSALVKYKGPS
jgi:hypothetical protein